VHLTDFSRPITCSSQSLVAKLRRTDQGMGFSIAGGMGSTPFQDNDPGIFVSKVVEGGQADVDGKLQYGDKILSVSPGLHAAQLLLCRANVTCPSVSCPVSFN